MHVWHCVQVTFSSGLLSPVPGLWIFGVCNVESGTCHWRQCSSGILAGLKRNWKLQLWFRQFGAQQNPKILYQGYHQPLRVVLPFLPKQCIKSKWPGQLLMCWYVLQYADICWRWFARVIGSFQLLGNSYRVQWLHYPQVSNEKNLVVLGIQGIILHSCMGIVMNHYKDPS